MTLLRRLLSRPVPLATHLARALPQPHSTRVWPCCGCCTDPGLSARTWHCTEVHHSPCGDCDEQSWDDGVAS